MRRIRLAGVMVIVLTLTCSFAMTSCGGGGGGDAGGDLVLVGFNLPNISGIPLNQPLIFTFNKALDPTSITPDSLRVIGALGPFFETPVVDGNLCALIPTIPNFANFSDAGLQPGVTYTVSMPVFPAPSTIRAVGGGPLIAAESFTFVTSPTPLFIEHRRPIVHGATPAQGGRSDDDGCLQNSLNALFQPPGTVQTGSGPGASLLCLYNEGAPRVVEAESSPRHDTSGVGVPSANPQFIGQVELPPIRLVLNEPLNPLTVVPYVPTLEEGVNVKLYRVAQKDGTAIVPELTATNQPQIVQTLERTEIILVASRPVLQGIYVVVLTPQIQDLAGNGIVITDDPNPANGGYAAYDANPDLAPGWRLYFRTLQLQDTALAIQETFSTNLNEYGDLASGSLEPGIFTQSSGTTDPVQAIPAATPSASPNFTLANNADDCGQTTTCNWNNGPTTGYRFLNISTLLANQEADTGSGTLKPVWQPYKGSGADGIFDTSVAPFGPGVNGIGFNTDTGSSDGIFEFVSFNLQSGDTITVTGSKPLLILCQGDCTIDGTIIANGGKGGPGLDTDGTAIYTNAGAAPAGGQGGLGVAGGGNGGNGANPTGPGTGGDGLAGTIGRTLFGGWPSGPVAGQPGQGADGTHSTGSGGGHASAGGVGDNSTATGAVSGGDFYGQPLFLRDTDQFTPDRGYGTNANIVGGAGGGGGGLDDDAEGGGVIGTQDNGDDGGGGGGGAGGGIWIICGGTLTVNGTILANGGAGGDTYAYADQTEDPGDDEDINTKDDNFITGALTGNLPSGEGAPGGGGAGGGIYLVGRTAVDIGATAVLSAQGGAGGTCGTPTLVGGQGSDGRIAIQSFGSAAADPTINAGASITPVATTTPRYNPVVDETSVGQSAWIDLFVTTTVFDPMVGPITATPSFNDNFDILTGAGEAQGGNWDAVWEVQGADDLVPLPPVAQTSAVGLTPWTPISAIGTLNGKRYLRWRWRFFVADAFPGRGASPVALPQVLDLLIPYATN